MKKRILSTLIVLAMVMGTLPSMAYADTPDDTTTNTTIDDISVDDTTNDDKIPSAPADDTTIDDTTPSTPVDDTPADDTTPSTPVDDTTNDDTTADDTPVDDTPVDDTTADDTTADDTTANDTSVESDDTPVESDDTTLESDDTTLALMSNEATVLSTTEYTVDDDSSTDLAAALADATSGDKITVTEDCTLSSTATVAKGVTLTIAAGVELIIANGVELTIADDATLTIAEYATISNGGTITNNGTIDNHYYIYNYSPTYNYGTINNNGTINNYKSATIKNELGSAGSGIINNNGSIQSVYTEGGALTLSADTVVAENDYFTWTKSDSNGSYDTLTLKQNMTITTSDNGILLLDGGTIDLDGNNLTINCSSNSGISSDGNLTIKGTGTLDITTTHVNSIGPSAGSSITIENVTVKIDADGGGIATNGAPITLNNVNATIEAVGDGISASGGGSVTINGDSNVTITTTADSAKGIFASNGTITIADTSDVTIDADGHGIYTTAYDDNSNTIDISINITTSGKVDITSDDKSYGIYAYVQNYDYENTPTANIAISNATVNADSICADDGTVTIAGVTIAAGIVADWTNYTGTSFTYANITNNGILILPTDTAIRDLAEYFTGTGYIALLNDDGTTDYTNNDGTPVNTVADNGGTLYLSDSDSDSTATGYTWTVAEGVGTLDVTEETVFACDIVIKDVTSAIITGDVTATGAIIMTDDGIDLTITGDVTAGGGIMAYSNLTINGDVIATSGIVANGDLVVSGDLIAGSVSASSMTVNTGATVEITTYGLELANYTTEPVLTLGTDVGIITPANGDYVTGEITKNTPDGDITYCFGTITTDGKAPTDDYSNIATEVSIGYVKTPSTGGSSGGSSSSSSSSSSSTTTTNDDDSVTTSVDASTSTSGSSVTATATDSKVENAIEDALDSADGETAHVEIAVETKSSTDTVDVVLSTDALIAVADSDVENLIINSDLGVITLSSDVLAEIVSQSTSDDITITVQHLDHDTHLNDRQKEVVGDAPVIDLIIKSGDEHITSFDGHEITVSVPYELKDGEDAKHIVVWYIDDEGNITVMDTDYDEDTEMATFETPHFSIYAIMYDDSDEVESEIEIETMFTDVPTNEYYYNPVMWAVANGITSGTTETTFAPYEACTRAQAVVFLYRAAGEPEVSGELTFSDVPANEYYYNAVLWAVENGITSGTTETTFSPEDDCTRSQIVAFLWNNAGKPVVNYAMDFEDVAADEWYAEAIRWAVSEGITAGTTETTFSPEALCDRGQIVTFLYRNMAE